MHLQRRADSGNEKNCYAFIFFNGPLNQAGRFVFAATCFDELPEALGSASITGQLGGLERRSCENIMLVTKKTVPS